MATKSGNDCFPPSGGRRLLFQGTPAIKTVKHYTHPDVEAEVTPLAVIQEGKDVWGDDELQWGLILQCVPRSVLKEVKDLGSALEPFEIDETFSAWGNPVRWWRGLQLLEAMPVLDHRNLGLELWIATGRPDKDDTFNQGMIEELCSTFAEGYSYAEIMARPVPMDVLQLTIQLLDEGQEMHSVRGDLTDEIEAGTVRWSQELKRVEVNHPDYRRAVRAAQAGVNERYRTHLFSYAAFSECSYEDDHNRKGFIMLCIERCIYDLIERGIEQEHGMDVTVMLAILSEEIGFDNISEELEKKHPRQGRKPFVRRTPDACFTEVMTWMTEHFPQAGPLPQKDELNRILHRLFEQWQTMPRTMPLVS